MGRRRLRRKVEAAFLAVSGRMDGQIPAISWGIAA